MNMEEPTPETVVKKKNPKGCLKIGLLSLVVLLVVLHFVTPPIARMIANAQMPKTLGTEARLDGLSLNLLTGRVGLRGLTLHQPEGFEGGPLLELERFTATAPVGKAIRQNPVTVNRVHLDGLALRLISDAEGVMNVTKLGPPPVEVEVEDSVPAEVPPVWVREVVLENISLVFQDLADDWEFEVTDIRFELRDLWVGGASAGGGPSPFSGELEIVGPKINARLLLRGNLGNIQPNNPDRVPPMQLAVGLIGFDLDIVSPFLVRGARSTLGGSGLDFILLAEIGEGGEPSEQSLYGSYVIVTDQGVEYSGELGGTLERPSLPFLNLIGDVVVSQLGRVVQLGGNIAEGGLDAARAAAETGVAAVRGAAGTVTGAARGLFRTTRGVVTLDREEAVGGLRDTTVGTAERAVGTVTDTAGTAAGGVGRAAGTALGRDAVALWWDTVDERVQLFESAAEEWLATRPFPD